MNSHLFIRTLLFSFLTFFSCLAQQPQQPRPKKLLTLEEIWNSKIFQEKSFSKVSPMKDGEHFTVLQVKDSTTEIVKYSFKNGKPVKTLIRSSDLVPDGKTDPISVDDYRFNTDESEILISTETEMIYRHSSMEKYFIYNVKSKKLKQLSDVKLRHAEFSPDGGKVAFLKGNDLFYAEIETGKEFRVTNDGEKNKIINGACDWVYEEEFGFDRAFFWSPDGKKIAFYKFDESRVKEYSMPKYGDLYPSEVKFKYPKAGEENSKVSIRIFDVATGTLSEVKVNSEFEYIPRIKWTLKPNILSIQLMNRLQNKLDLAIFNTATNALNIILTETNDTYIEIHDHLVFLPVEEESKEEFPDNDGFLWTSDRNGYNHIYQYDMEGTRLRQVTEGNWDVTEIKGYEVPTKTIFYVSSEVSPRQRDIYSVKIDGRDKFKITTTDGHHDCVFSSDFNYFIDYYSNANTPIQTSIYSAVGDQVAVLEDNNILRDTLKTYKISNKKFFIFKTKEGIDLNGWLINPPDLDRTKKYPVFMYVYGGPGSQTVLDRWDGKSYLWHQLLAQKGYIIISVDNRGTGSRGADFRKCTYKQLGKFETIDQIEAAKYLGTLNTVDKSRIGIMGWSYGGYMSSLCILKGSDYFKTAIAVAPVTHWKFYDTIYTERYMQRPEDNKDGYENNSPLNFTDSLKGKYLIVHGTGDDNVHFQNTAEMINALTKSGKQFEQLIYPDKNHGLYGGNTRLHLYTKMTDFILGNL
ncbi:MAG: S9 family peptidase [Bacteroidetes bacterium]|nr:S9 family peptidase [Bacteroidota bacterium]